MYKNILVPLDFSKLSERNFYVGCLMTNHGKANLHLIHVIDIYSQAYLSGNKADKDKMYYDAKEKMDDFVSNIPHPKTNIIKVIKFGCPNDEILIYAIKNNIDLIIRSSNENIKEIEYSLEEPLAGKVLNITKIPTLYLQESIIRNETKHICDPSDYWFG